MRKEKNRLHPQDKGRLVIAFPGQLFRALCRLRLYGGSRDRSRPGDDGDEDWKALLDEDSAALETAELHHRRPGEDQWCWSRILAATPEDPGTVRCKGPARGLSLGPLGGGSSVARTIPNATRPLAGRAAMRRARQRARATRPDCR